MGFFDFLKEENTEPQENRNVESNMTNINSLLGIQEEGLSIAKVESIPAVQACTNLICGTIASLPIYLYRESLDGDVERVFGDKRETLLNNEPNPIQNAYNFKKALVKDYLFHGIGACKVEWENNEVVELWGLQGDKISVTKYHTDGYKLQADIKYSGDSGQVTFAPDELIMILKDSYDGLTSEGLLKTGAETFKIALSEYEYTKNVFNRGALPIGILKTTGRLSKDAILKLKASWQSLYGQGSRTAASTIVLEEGLDYTPVSLNPQDLDLTNSKKNSTSEICRLFGVPESLINANANKYGSVSQNNLHFLQYGLNSILTSIENSLNKNLLLETEKEEGLFFAFDTSEVLRTTEKEKYESLQMALNSGIISLNEARQKINMNKIDKNFFRWTIGNVLYDPDKDEMIIPNLGIGIDENGKKSSTTGNENEEQQEITNEKENKEEVKSNDE